MQAVLRRLLLHARFPVSRLTDPDGFIGIDGAFRFAANGMSERTLEVREVQAGKYGVLDPAPRGFTLAAK
jgi:hypothetical protein